MQIGQRTDGFGTDDQSWLGSRRGTETPQTCTIKTSTLTANTHYPAGYIPSGLPIAKFTSGGNTGKFTVLNTAASDGSQVLWGYLLDAQPVKDATKDVVCSYIETGRIRIPRLPTAFQSLITTGVQAANTRFTYTTTA